jgi:hypothetical protein
VRFCSMAGGPFHLVVSSVAARRRHTPDVLTSGLEAARLPSTDRSAVKNRDWKNFVLTLNLACSANPQGTAWQQTLRIYSLMPQWRICSGGVWRCRIPLSTSVVAEAPSINLSGEMLEEETRGRSTLSLAGLIALTGFGECSGLEL